MSKLRFSILCSNNNLLRRALFWIALVIQISLSGSASASSETQLWAGLASGEYVGLIRHALAPGNGDPDEFSLRDCATQRNLSEEGRDQARRIGSRITQAVGAVDVYSSQWCRCLETARLLGFGDVREMPAFNSFYQRYEREPAQTKAMRSWLRQRDVTKPTVVVTHQVNITSLANMYAGSGEIVFVSTSADGTVQFAGSLPMP